MSLASQAILEVEGKISDRLREHEEAISALSHKTDQDLAAAAEASGKAILAYQKAKESQLTGEIAQKETASQQQISEEVARLTDKVAQKEAELIASILEEVRTRYGGI
ncbi:hypothetical protein AB6M97_00310 [Streptococcus hillyeri]|uniref:Uncharacterized protein n=1 Tax=Streptococcus hillyeri TaxID=2282420 RepID=A0A3L9DPW3_9STRE|nr:hypothetical protein [Streptococcus hillyeri]RLY02674.1 hypothetical protein EAF07_07140 [Streptococcus hillyeri]